MRDDLVLLLVGLAGGVAYALIKVRSPTPPVIALVGLLGMLAGEQFVPLLLQALYGREAAGAPRRPLLAGCALLREI